MITLCMIVARSHNGVIGYQGTLPWQLPEELRFFRRCTINNTVLMGRVTWESLLYRPLPHRRNIVISSTLQDIDGAELFPTVDAALSSLTSQERLFVIGGESLYTILRDTMDYIFLTEVDLVVLGDRFFTDLDPDAWELVYKKNNFSKSCVSFAYHVYRRISSNAPILDYMPYFL